MVIFTPTDTSAKDLPRKAFAGMKEEALMESPRDTKIPALPVTIIWSFSVK